MMTEQDVDLLLTKLGAAVQDTEMGTQYTALYSQADSLDRFFGSEGEEAEAKALWGMSWESLKEKGRDLWKRVSPRLHDAFCDKESESHKKLADLLEKGETGLDAALAALVIQTLAAAFPVVAASAVAFFLAKLILKLFITESLGLACDEWEKTLSET